MHFSNIKENKISDRNTCVEILLLEEPQYGSDPLMITQLFDTVIGVCVCMYQIDIYCKL